MPDVDRVNQIVMAAQLAAMLEVSGWPKPGNVHRTMDLPDTRFEHFLAGAAAMGPALRSVALNGMKAGRGIIEVSEIGVGKYVKQAIADVKALHKGGNTHLGVVLLFIPLAAAAGKTYVEGGRITAQELRRNVREITRKTTPHDAAEVYDAILMVSSVQELGRISGIAAPDLYDKEARKKMFGEKISLYDVMKISSKWDTIASEWATGMRISFEVGYPTLSKVFRQTGDINTATVHTFLTVLAGFPDTFIARKVGLKEASDIKRAIEIGRRRIAWISKRAKNILDLGGLMTRAGRGALLGLDIVLHEARGELNPGTSADLTAASLMIAILCGLRF